MVSIVQKCTLRSLNRVSLAVTVTCLKSSQMDTQMLESLLVCREKGS